MLEHMGEAALILPSAPPWTLLLPWMHPAPPGSAIRSPSLRAPSGGLHAHSQKPLLPAVSLCLALPSWADSVDWAGALSLLGDTCSAVFGGILPCSHEREDGSVSK